MAAMSSANGKNSVEELQELTRRVGALELRMDRELTAMVQAIATALKFHEKVSERLDQMQQVLVEAGRPGARKNGEPRRDDKASVESPACDDELDAKILALRRKLQTPD
jgi:hypothetical protein